MFTIYILVMLPSKVEAAKMSNLRFNSSFYETYKPTHLSSNYLWWNQKSIAIAHIFLHGTVG